MMSHWPWIVVWNKFRTQLVKVQVPCLKITIWVEYFYEGDSDASLNSNMPKPHLSKKSSNKGSPLSMSSMVKMLPPVLLSTMSTVSGFSMSFHRLNTNVNINPKHYNNNFQRRLQRQLYGQVFAPVRRRFSSTTCTMRLNPASVRILCFY